MPKKIIDLLNNGLNANLNDKFRNGNIVSLHSEGILVVSGDIHGHRRNFERIVDFADLKKNPDTHLLLQEIIHGGPQDSAGGCLSYRLLFDVVRLKLDFPDQVHIIMGNHDTAYINNTQIMKNGKEMNQSMRLAIKRQFKQKFDDIETAIKNFLLSLPLAIKCQNRIWLSHSLPSGRLVDKFDMDIFQKKLQVNDTKKPGSAYLLTWGRNFTQQLLDRMAVLLDVDTFILGHQTQEKGFANPHKNLIIITSEHNHGYLLSIDLEKAYTTEDLVSKLVPLASIS